MLRRNNMSRPFSPNALVQPDFLPFSAHENLFLQRRNRVVIHLIFMDQRYHCRVEDFCL